MAAVDLLFEFPPSTNGDLLFGETLVPVVQHLDATLTATLPALTFSATAIPNTHATLTATLPAMTFTAQAIYASYAQRPTVAATESAWEGTETALAGVSDAIESPIRQKIGAKATWSPANAISANVSAKLPGNLKPAPLARRSSYFNATRGGTWQHHPAWQEGMRDRRPSRSTGYAEGIALRKRRAARHQDTIRDRRTARTVAHADTVALRRALGWAFYAADDLRIPVATREKNAMRPPAGKYTPPPTPPTAGCYTPSGNLLFNTQPDGTGNLLFICDNRTAPPGGGTVIIPVRKIYMQTNTQSLILATNGQPIPARNIRLSIDTDSWAWGWSASVPASYLSALQPIDGNLIEVIVTLNGTAFRLSVESIKRDRSFAKATLSISGRGRAAWLAAPKSDVVSRGNTAAMTAQQLMTDVLTENGVSIGWAVDWKITDWLVPAGVWSHTGAAMDACIAIADAAGAYIQSHRTDQTLSVLPRYPAVPWHWNALTPDIVLPEDVCVTEGIEWMEKPDYNAVYVSGQTGGILGHVTRTGTDGSKAAPMVTDALISHSDAARQRGISILSNTGRQKHITLSLPVLAATGIIVPGKLVRYTESGNTHLGLTRAVEVSADFPKIRQSITIESHVI